MTFTRACWIVLFAFSVLQAGSLRAEEKPRPGKTAAPASGEMQALRELIEEQTKQIEALRQAVAQLSERLPAKPAAPAAPEPAAVPLTPITPPPAPAASTENAPHAEPAGPLHTVAKGETLTSIAKAYNITIAELQKANKVTDDRKLQIGQVLKIPAAKAETATPTPTDKKENP